ncbi:MAG: ATP-binding cassette domain-containing protein, partial [Methylobacteriaceae bacterium]|nr:ATP-binding cassette domain-containing protein [Methylobacteriaceae bacterium]
MNAISVEEVSKTFTLHLRGGARLPVVTGASFAVGFGECVVLGGPSGAGKSSVLKMIYGTYRVDAGRIRVADGAETVDIVSAEPRRVLALRRRAISYVTQFLRVIPRVATLDVVAEPLLAAGVEPAAARARASELLTRLNLAER